MDLYLIPNNPEHTLLVSANGVPHYQIDTADCKRGTSVTLIQRPGAALDDSVVAEIEWGERESDMLTIIRSPMLPTPGQCSDDSRGAGIKGPDYLYKRHRFGTTRYFIADDAEEYRWKMIKDVGCMLSRSDSNTEIASSMSLLSTEGLFAGEKKHVLRVQPCSIDIDIVVLTFLMMEKRRRDRDGNGSDSYKTPHDADPLGDGGGDVGGDTGDVGGDVGLVGEL